MNDGRAAPPPDCNPGLSRDVGFFDATMVVMGGIIGSGIFINPYIVARQVHAPALIIAAWLFGGLIGLGGAFIWAELAAITPAVGGQYVYLRDAFHPAVAFLYGWVLLLVIQTGGMAAVAITAGRYLIELTGIRRNEWVFATIVICALTIINCLGVKAGARTQSALMVLKIVAIAGLVLAAFIVSPSPAIASASRESSLANFGAAMVPVAFAYGGWQTANFIAGEIKQPERNLPRALLIGVAGVVFLYVTVNWGCVRALGPAGLAGTTTPATAVMRLELGERGAKFIAAAIALSTVGFLSQSILTAPRVYFAMAEDGLFFPSLARLDPRTRVPVRAIVLQSLWSIVIAVSGRYEQILNYVVSMDFLFFGLTASTLFMFRRRDRTTAAFRVPGHPLTTALFIAVCFWIVGNTIYKYPLQALAGYGLLFAGVPVYLLCRRNVIK